MLTGSIPLTSSISEPITTEDADPKAPYASPTLMVTFLFHSASAFYTYTRYVTTGQGLYLFGVLVNSFIAAVGLWCLLFATSNGKISRKTGADKRASGFPFANAEASKRFAGKKSR